MGDSGAGNHALLLASWLEAPWKVLVTLKRLTFALRRELETQGRLDSARIPVAQVSRQSLASASTVPTFVLRTAWKAFRHQLHCMA